MFDIDNVNHIISRVYIVLERAEISPLVANSIVKI